jgi:hypothetical protein
MARELETCRWNGSQDLSCCKNQIGVTFPLLQLAHEKNDRIPAIRIEAHR